MNLSLCWMLLELAQGAFSGCIEDCAFIIIPIPKKFTIIELNDYKSVILISVAINSHYVYGYFYLDLQFFNRTTGAAGGY